MTTSARDTARIVDRGVLQSAADLSITMIAGGNHTEIKMVIAPYKVYDKYEFEQHFHSMHWKEKCAKK